MSVYLSTKVY